MTRELFKFAGAIVDCYDDPIFIETAQARSLFDSRLLSPEKLGDLSDNEFAVKIASRSGDQRRFPTYNEEITKVSCLYFNNNHDRLPLEIREAAGRKLNDACDKYGISKVASVQQYAQAKIVPRVSYITKTASGINVDNDTLTKVAEDRLAIELYKMAPRDRTRAATEFHKVAGEDAITRPAVWDYVEKPVAGPNLDSCLDDREMLLKSATSKAPSNAHEIFINLRNALEDSDPTEIIDTLKSFDKYAGLNTRYGKGLADPYVSVYGGWPLPKIRKAMLDMSKEAEIVDGQTSQPVAPETSRGLSVEQHIFNLKKQFPKGSSSFIKAAQAPSSDRMLSVYGPNYVKAREIYFGS